MTNESNKDNSKKIARWVIIAISLLMVFFVGYVYSCWIGFKNYSNQRSTRSAYEDIRRHLMNDKKSSQKPVCKYRNSIFFDKYFKLPQVYIFNMTMSGNFMYFLASERTSKDYSKFVLLRQDLSPETSPDVQSEYIETIGLSYGRITMKPAGDGCLYFFAQDIELDKASDLFEKKGFVVFKLDPNEMKILYKRTLSEFNTLNALELGKQGHLFVMVDHSEIIGVDTSVSPQSPLIYMRKFPLESAVTETMKQEMLNRLSGDENRKRQFEKHVRFRIHTSSLCSAPDGTLIVSQIISPYFEYPEQNKKLQAEKNSDSEFNSEFYKKMEAMFFDKIIITKLNPYLPYDKQIICKKCIPYYYAHNRYCMYACSRIESFAGKNDKVFFSFDFAHVSGHTGYVRSEVLFLDLKKADKDCCVHKLLFDRMNAYFIQYSECTNMLSIGLPSNQYYQSNMHNKYGVGTRIMNVDCDSFRTVSDESYWSRAEVLEISCAAQDEKGRLYLCADILSSDFLGTSAHNYSYRIIGIDPIK